MRGVGSFTWTLLDFVQLECAALACGQFVITITYSLTFQYLSSECQRFCRDSARSGESYVTQKA
jgi:hypothetical protein